MATRILLISCLLALVALAGCGGGGAAEDRPDPGRTPVASEEEDELGAVPVQADPVEGRFDIGDDRKLWLRCEGPAGPAVVYLHPYVADDSGAGAQDAGALPDYLVERHRVCVYDRANVGRSSKVAGRQTGADSVRDLHRLLIAADVEGPYVLVGSGFGGLLAGIYAATHPEDVAGMVLVDARLPGDLAVEERFFPEELRVQPGSWARTVERIDALATFEEASELDGQEPRVPLTYVGPEDLALDPALDEQRVTAVVRDMQASFVERFAPGRLVLVDSARPMEAVVPDRIAEEVERVIEEAAEAP